MKSSSFFASFIVSALALLVFLGVRADQKAITPPDFGRGCRIAEADVRDETPPPENPPPPAKVAESSSGEASIENQEFLPLFDEAQLSSRAGFGLTSSNDPETWARRLGAGWYVDWTVRFRSPEQLPEHWQMIRLGRGCMYPSKEAIQWLAHRFPGNVWIIGNEPDNIWQDNVFPEEYAQVYHELYYLIKAADPRAKVAVAGVTQGTPMRLAYLDRVLLIYQALYNEPMPVDWWTLHGFVLREEQGNWGAGIPTGLFAGGSGELYEIEDVGSLAYFQQHILNFRTWMFENGYRDVPLAITEYSILVGQDFGYTPEVVGQYLVDTFTWMASAADDQIGYPADENHLVQRWAWFSLYDPLYPTPSLAHIDADALTDIGLAFRNAVENWSP